MKKIQLAFSVESAQKKFDEGKQQEAIQDLRALSNQGNIHATAEIKKSPKLLLTVLDKEAIRNH